VRTFNSGTKIVIGLIIQGPINSTGKKNDGPNSVGYFDTVAYINKNIETFIKYVDKIIISTWENSGLKDKITTAKNIFIIENRGIEIFDFDNRRKQFLTIYEGVKFLKNNSNCTHVFKIRTDQIVDVEILNWMHKIYDKNFSRIKFGRFKLQKEKLFFSEIISNHNFYAGDFIIGGNINDVYNFSESILSFGKKDIHPTAANDFILKYFMKNDMYFRRYFIVYIPFIFQNMFNKNSKKYWIFLLQNNITVIPMNVFKNIYWRGNNMYNIFPNFSYDFLFFENFIHYEDINKENNMYTSLKQIFNEYKRYYIKQMIPSKFSFIKKSLQFF